MHCGELIALIGPNGGGKTTLLRAMLGEIAHTGDLRFLPSGNTENRPPRIGYVPQKLDLDFRSPVTVLDLFSGAISRWPLWLGYRRSTVNQAAEALSAVASADLLDARISNLSGGELQRVLLALALTPRPEILLLDEPVAGLDQAGTSLFYQTISQLREKYDLSILLISHDLAAAARVADRMIFLNHRICCDGSPEEVLGDESVRRAFGLGLALSEISHAKPLLTHHAQHRQEGLP